MWPDGIHPSAFVMPPRGDRSRRLGGRACRRHWPHWSPFPCRCVAGRLRASTARTGHLDSRVAAGRAGPRGRGTSCSSPEHRSAERRAWLRAMPVAYPMGRCRGDESGPPGLSLTSGGVADFESTQTGQGDHVPSRDVRCTFMATGGGEENRWRGTQPEGPGNVSGPTRYSMASATDVALPDTSGMTSHPP